MAISVNPDSTGVASPVLIDPPAQTAPAATDYAKLRVDNTAAVTIPAGTTAIAASLHVAEPNLTATGTVTDGVTVYIEGAPTEGGTGNWALWVDSGATRFDGNVQLQGGTATASGGAATLNSTSGTITSEALTTAAGADYTLTLTNSVVAATSVVVASVAQGTNTTEGLSVQRITPGSGSVVILVRNTHASSALNGTVKISFAVFR